MTLGAILAIMFQGSAKEFARRSFKDGLSSSNPADIVSFFFELLLFIFRIFLDLTCNTSAFEQRWRHWLEGISSPVPEPELHCRTEDPLYN
jgi:hypothetical protein